MPASISLYYVSTQMHILPLVAVLGVKGAALAARGVIVEDPVELLASPIGVNDGESTLRLFLGLLKTHSKPRHTKGHHSSGNE